MRRADVRFVGSYKGPEVRQAQGRFQYEALDAERVLMGRRVHRWSLVRIDCETI